MEGIVENRGDRKLFRSSSIQLVVQRCQINLNETLWLQKFLIGERSYFVMFQEKRMVITLRLIRKLS